MSIKKTNESVDSIDIMRISQELILKNRTVYKHLAADILFNKFLMKSSQD